MDGFVLAALLYLGSGARSPCSPSNATYNRPHSNLQSFTTDLGDPMKGVDSGKPAIPVM
jgi:hypothetical protein